MILPGSKIRIKLKDNRFVDAKVLQMGEFPGETMWWVQYEQGNITETTLYSENDLHGWNINYKCTCGVESLGYKPVKHSEWCDKVDSWY